jgi:hypothetical protein
MSYHSRVAADVDSHQLHNMFGFILFGSVDTINSVNSAREFVDMDKLVECN